MAAGQPKLSIHIQGGCSRPADNAESRSRRTSVAEQESGRDETKEAMPTTNGIQLKPEQPEQASAFARALYEESAAWHFLQPVQIARLAELPEATGDWLDRPGRTPTTGVIYDCRPDRSGLRAIRWVPCGLPAGRPRGAGPQVPSISQETHLVEFITAAAAGREPRPVVLNHGRITAIRRIIGQRDEFRQNRLRGGRQRGD